MAQIIFNTADMRSIARKSVRHDFLVDKIVANTANMRALARILGHYHFVATSNLFDSANEATMTLKLQDDG